LRRYRIGEIEHERRDFDAVFAFDSACGCFEGVAVSRDEDEIVSVGREFSRELIADSG
jgi:hypothetical protein